MSTGRWLRKRQVPECFDTALDQFGPNSRISGLTGVESSYNNYRGGDIDELQVYDRALSDENIAQLAHSEIPQSVPVLPGIIPTAWRKNGGSTMAGTVETIGGRFLHLSPPSARWRFLMSRT
jgi:hypothetical protein